MTIHLLGHIIEVSRFVRGTGETSTATHVRLALSDEPKEGERHGQARGVMEMEYGEEEAQAMWLHADLGQQFHLFLEAAHPPQSGA